MSEYHPALCTANREAYRKLIKRVSLGTTSSSRLWLLVVKIIAMMIHKKYNSVFDIPFIASAHHPVRQDHNTDLDARLSIYLELVSIFCKSATSTTEAASDMKTSSSTSVIKQQELKSGSDVFNRLDFEKHPVELVQLPFEAFICLSQMCVVNAFSHFSPEESGNDELEFGASTQGAGIFLSDACTFVNHSCLPTCTVNGQALLCLSEVKAGEEVTISYIPTELSLSERTDRLNIVYNFTCHCELCKYQRLAEELQRQRKK
jgi:hypothetical protein